LKDGFLTVWETLPMRVLLIAAMCMNLFAFMGFGTFVVYVTEVLVLPEQYFGILWGISSLGAVLLGIFNAAKSHVIKTKPLLFFAFIDFAITNLGLGLFHNFWACAILLFLQGVPMVLISSRAWTVAQAQIPVDKLGRFVGIFAFFQIAAWGSSSLIGGVIAQFLGAAAPFTVSGICVILILATASRWYLKTDIPFDRDTIVEPPKKVKKRSITDT
jgi:hypothetical protein